MASARAAAVLPTHELPPMMRPLTAVALKGVGSVLLKRSRVRLRVIHLQVLVQLLVAPHAPYLAVEIVVRERAAPDEGHPEAVGFDQGVMRNVVGRAEQHSEADVGPDVLADDRRRAVTPRAFARILVTVMEPDDAVV